MTSQNGSHMAENKDLYLLRKALEIESIGAYEFRFASSQNLCFVFFFFFLSIMCYSQICKTIQQPCSQGGYRKKTVCNFGYRICYKLVGKLQPNSINKDGHMIL